jgi:ribosome-binding protein aMBF1 (putative translation factor)
MIKRNKTKNNAVKVKEEPKEPQPKTRRKIRKLLAERVADEEARAAWHEKEKEYQDIITAFGEAIQGAKRQIVLFNKQLAQRGHSLKKLVHGDMSWTKNRMPTQAEWDAISTSKA